MRVVIYINGISDSNKYKPKHKKKKHVKHTISPNLVQSNTVLKF